MRFLATGILLIIGYLPVYADEQVLVGTEMTITSSVLQEERTYSVNLPDSYTDGYNGSYPVLYLLDGKAHFRAAAGVINHMTAGTNGNYQIPELIVVAVHNNGNRTRDLTPYNSTIGYDGEQTDTFAASGGGGNFVRFMEKELIPHIDATYRTRPHRTLVGHSLGGLLVLHTLMTQPTLFQNYIAIDSSLWWDGSSMLNLAEAFAADNADVKARVYMSMADHKPGENGEPSKMLSTNQLFAQRLESGELKQLDLATRKFANEDHGSVPLISLYYGLLHGFDNYKIPIATLIAGADAVTAHFKVFSETLDQEFLPPETMVSLAVTYLSGRMEPGVARELLELNAANYPQSTQAKEALEEYGNEK